MKFGKACVEQIAVDGTIVKDNDVSLSPGEMEKVLKEFFPKLEKAQWGQMCLRENIKTGSMP